MGHSRQSYPFQSLFNVPAVWIRIDNRIGREKFYIARHITYYVALRKSSLYLFFTRFG